MSKKLREQEDDFTHYFNATLRANSEIADLRAQLDAANARIAELDAEYRRLWDAGIDHANSGGTVDAGKPEETYAALFRALMQSRFWNESDVANANVGASPADA